MGFSDDSDKNYQKIKKRPTIPRRDTRSVKSEPVKSGWDFSRKLSPHIERSRKLENSNLFFIKYLLYF